MTAPKFRPILSNERTNDAVQLGDWPLWFSHAFELRRNADPVRVSVRNIPKDILDRISTPRSAISGVQLDRPRLMGVLNVTPDSFSDGGLHNEAEKAVLRAKEMIANGVDIVDVGGESTRPGADLVEAEAEIARTLPVIRRLKEEKLCAAISIDTRKASVAKAALSAGVSIFNDVSALTFDASSLQLVGKEKPAVCLMHASGAPKTMQDNPNYKDVVLDVYDFLEQRVEACLDLGLTRDQILVDPGIGFGKTVDHNLQLIRNLAVFHGLGCPILLGVSRKRFIGELTNTPNAADRGAGSVAAALYGLSQGVQIIRAHDIGLHTQAMKMWWEMQGET